MRGRDVPAEFPVKCNYTEMVQVILVNKRIEQAHSGLKIFNVTTNKAV
jgi:hypothetical protein